MLKNKDTTKGSNGAKGVAMITKQWTGVLGEVEKLWLVCATEKQLTGDSIHETTICEKDKILQ